MLRSAQASFRFELRSADCRVVLIPVTKWSHGTVAPPLREMIDSGASRSLPTGPAGGQESDTDDECCTPENEGQWTVLMLCDGLHQES